MSMYGVNAAVPKTLMRAMVLYLASLSESEGKTALAEVLRDIVSTPVSPELTPPKDDGEIAQCTESIVGPYELNDYFLYFLTRYGFSPRKILRLATASFAGKYDREYILGWLRVFLRRFFSQQFKRSCLPDGPSVGSVSLSPRAGFKMPSDMASKIWLDELK
jgi:NAD+ synthase (glutamine-hydrolysing)